MVVVARAAKRGFADFLHWVEGVALGIFLLIDFPVAEHLGNHFRGQGVDAADADAVQTARDLVGTFVELTAGVEHGHHDFQGGAVLLGVHVDGDAAAVVLHGYGVVLADRHLDVRAITGQSLVDGVVHRLIDQVVQTLLADVAYIHGGALAHRFQSFQYLNVTGGIGGIVRLRIFHIAFSIFLLAV